MGEPTATCYELRVFVTVANDAGGRPLYSAEDVADGTMRALLHSVFVGGCDVEIIATTTVDE